jgi:23S rRNA (adenine2503-C2)-methyltransferase
LIQPQTYASHALQFLTAQETLMTSIYDSQGLDRVFRELKLDPGRLLRLQRAFFKRGTPFEVAVAAAGFQDLNDLNERLKIQWNFLTLDSTVSSEEDGTVKLLLRTKEGRPVETVLLRSISGRLTLCVSSQSGCALGCRFCASGVIRPVVDLSRDEILDQLDQAQRLLTALTPSKNRTGRKNSRPINQRIPNIVFMGMGEPLQNELSLHASLDVLLAPEGYDYPPRRITVSTIGRTDAMIRFAERQPDVRLAVSLHSARQETRDRLMPGARRWPLDELRHTIQEVGRIQDRPVMIEYVLLRDENDGANDLIALLEYLDGLSVRVNLLPYNGPRPDVQPDATDEPPRFQASPQETSETFFRALREKGIETTRRNSRGGDVNAACGQLAGKTDRQSENTRINQEPHDE